MGCDVRQGSTGAVEPGQAYDLAADRGQQRNLAGAAALRELQVPGDAPGEE